MTEPLRRIVVIGPESTGKSSLCQALADHYGNLWCPEYARHYLEENGPHYEATDLVKIAAGQIKQEDDLARQAAGQGDSYLFIDTDLYVMKIWSEFAFNSCHHYILDAIARRPYDLYLLCHIDLPWTADPLREYPDPDTRLALFHMYRDLLVQQSVPFVEIKGTDEQRIVPAIEAIDGLFAKQ